MFKYIISYDGGQLRDSGDFEWGLFNSYGEAEEAANDAKEEYFYRVTYLMSLSFRGQAHFLCLSVYVSNK